MSRRLLLALVFLLLPVSARAEGETRLSFSTGYSYSTGDYGQPVSTQIRYVPNTIKWASGAWTARLLVPYISITGPGVVAGDVPVGPALAKSGTESGLGDITPGLSWSHRLSPSGTTAELSGFIKLPTADEDKHLGTGLADYTLQAGLTQPFGQMYLNGNVGRKFNGADDEFPLRDVWKYTAGGGYRFAGATTGGLVYDYRQPQTSGGSSLSLMTAYLSQTLSENWAVQLYGSKGFTNGSPDTGVGLQLNYSFIAP